MTRISLFTALIIVLSQVSIPMPFGVPITLQTFIIPLAGIVLGKRDGTIAVLLYLMLGLIGLPVFANFSGGAAIFMGPTGGFLLSFPVLSYLAGLGAESHKTNHLVTGLISGVTLNYLVGVLFFMFVTNQSFWFALTVCVVPFLLVDFIKVFILITLTKRLEKFQLVALAK